MGHSLLVSLWLDRSAVVAGGTRGVPIFLVSTTPQFFASVETEGLNLRTNPTAVQIRVVDVNAGVDTGQAHVG